MKHHYVGIDAARGGWVCITLRAGQEISFGLFKTIAEAWRAYQDAAKILIDIPIGLASNGPRRCDQLARKELGKRRSSVFSPPCREAIYQSCYAEACVVNKQLTRKRISKQAWNISPKIREVDGFLQSHSDLSEVLLEAHPELSFAAFAGHPMRHNKKTREGFEERFQLLSGHKSGFKKSYHNARGRWNKSTVADDDLLDSAVLALAASCKDWLLEPLPNPPDYDSIGLHMQIVRPVGFVI